MGGFKVNKLCLSWFVIMSMIVVLLIDAAAAEAEKENDKLWRITCEVIGFVIPGCTSKNDNSLYTRLPPARYDRDPYSLH